MVSELPPLPLSTAHDRRPTVPVVIGVDAHKKTHTLVALDGNGRKLAEKTVEATDTGHAKALRLALLKFTGEELTWGIELPSCVGALGAQPC
jgi:hypothetical protein